MMYNMYKHWTNKKNDAKYPKLGNMLWRCGPRDLPCTVALFSSDQSLFFSGMIIYFFSFGCRRRYSPGRRSPHGYHHRRYSPGRRPWSPPPNRKTGVGKPGKNLFVAGFSFLTTERDLERKFSRFGRVRDVRIVRNKR